MSANDAAGIMRALTDVLGPVHPAMVLLWLASAIALACVLVFGWQRLFRH